MGEWGLGNGCMDGGGEGRLYRGCGWNDWELLRGYFEGKGGDNGIVMIISLFYYVVVLLCPMLLFLCSASFVPSFRQLHLISPPSHLFANHVSPDKKKRRKRSQKKKKRKRKEENGKTPILPRHT